MTPMISRDRRKVKRGVVQFPHVWGPFSPSGYKKPGVGELPPDREKGAHVCGKGGFGLGCPPGPHPLGIDPMALESKPTAWAPLSPSPGFGPEKGNLGPMRNDLKGCSNSCWARKGPECGSTAWVFPPRK
ncbi:MAG: hypothetical protein CM15mP77_3980 [Synechococcus sp.]|nr:MAG: hypothetical protein CM15mP77_3980 [Synechococcus sp.]